MDASVEGLPEPGGLHAADASVVSLSPSPASPMPRIREEDEHDGEPDRFDFVTNYGLQSIDSYDQLWISFISDLLSTATY